MPAGARRPHRKTKNGCLGCKARRIKCDEVKPSCRTCTRYSTPCTYPTNISPQPTRSPPTLVPPFQQDSLSSPRPVPQAQVGPYPSLPLFPFNTQHLELLHLYTTTTAFTFTTLPERARIYQHIIPQLAFSHPFLLSGIMSLSALHLASLSPSRADQLRRDSVEYHDLALRGFKEELGRLRRENFEALYVFSMFLVVCAWASGEGKANLFFCEEGEGETAEWVRLLRGTRTLVRDCFDWITSGPCKSFVLLYNDQPLVFDLPEEDAVRFAALEVLWDSQNTLPATQKETLSEALRILKELYAMLLHYGFNSTQLCSIATTIGWSTVMPDLYMELVSQRQPEALVLLAHYCLLLSKIDNVWWLKGISRHLLRSVCRILEKAAKEGKGWESWERWVAWPLQELALREFREPGEERMVGLMREENRLGILGT